MKTLIIADNQDISRIGLKALALASDAVSSVHEAKDKASIIELLINNPQSVVLLDYALSEFSSVNELLILHQRFPETYWVLFSDELSEPLIRTFTTNNYPFNIVLKSSKLHEIRMALSSATQGNHFTCSQITEILTSGGKTTESATEPLTQTEKEILRAMAQGKTTKEIAFTRNSSFHTVMTHRKNIFRKLNVNNIHEAIKYALRAGLIDASDYYI